MPRSISSSTTLEHLRKDARRWLNGLRAGDPAALERLRNVVPTTSHRVVLRDVQHALAREYGEASWIALKARVVEMQASGARPRPASAAADESAADTFLSHACLDWRAGGPERGQRAHAASRLLERSPGIAATSLAAAVVTGGTQLVAQRLASNRDAANQPAGPRGWPPLLYLCAARLASPGPWSDNAATVADMLLDAGADPNAFYEGGNPAIHYTALTCLVGRGEEQATQHPCARELAALLLERGAEPYDVQVLYNGFGGHASLPDLTDDDLVWLLDLIYEHASKRGRSEDWRDPAWTMLSMGGYGCGAWYLLSSALAANSLRIAEWALAHGASPDPPRPAPPAGAPHTLFQRAVLNGQRAFARLLADAGADQSLPSLSPAALFLDACFAMDHAAVEKAMAAHHEHLHDPAPLLAAAARDRADVATMLLDLGVSPDIHGDNGMRPLHAAAFNGSLHVVRLLIDRGAVVDPHDSQYGTTPISWAFWGGQLNAVDLLAPHSRDIWVLVEAGHAGRVRDVLAADPSLATTRRGDDSLLFHLPDDDVAAAAIVTMLRANGADASVRLQNGTTPAALARQRGLEQAARLLDSTNEGQ